MQPITELHYIVVTSSSICCLSAILKVVGYKKIAVAIQPNYCFCPCEGAVLFVAYEKRHTIATTTNYCVAELRNVARNYQLLVEKKLFK